MEHISELKCCVVGNSVTLDFHEKKIEKFLIFKVTDSLIIRGQLLESRTKTRGIFLIL